MCMHMNKQRMCEDFEPDVVPVVMGALQDVKTKLKQVLLLGTTQLHKQNPK